MPIDLTEIPWHDGVLHDIHISGFSGKRRELELSVELYPDRDSASRRRRYRCVGKGLRRFLTSGDVALMVENAGAGNIDHMTMRLTADTETLVLMLFGGYIEAEATKFTLKEVKP